jgi:hypothetical protein
MVDTITSFDISVSHKPDQDHTVVVGTFPTLAERDREYLTQSFGALWPDDQHFELELQYARTYSTQFRESERTTLHFEPKEQAVPLVALVEEATRQAEDRLAWPVQSIEVVHEKSTHTFGNGWTRLELRTDFTVRVTQSSQR